MRTLPTQMIRVLLPFVPLFSKRVWQHAQVLLAGAILAPGARTVSSALIAMGLDQQKRFHRYHRVLEPRQLVESGRPVACCWGWWWRRSCPRELLWS